MKVDVIAKRPAKGDLVEFAAQGSKPLPGVAPAEFDGGALSTLLVRAAGSRTLHVGLGDVKKAAPAPRLLRKAAGTAVKTLLKAGAEEITIALGRHDAPAQVEAVVEGALLAAYKFEAYKAPASRRKNALKRLNLLADPGELARARKAAHAGAVVARSVNLVRDIGNRPPNEITPEALADRARQLARSHKLRCEVWDERRLEKEGFGGIIAVGKGSAVPPRFIVLEYRGPGVKASAKPVAVVGKAITFDTGGISIKPGDRMDEMKFDKMGGCAVLGVLQAVAELKLPLRVVGLIASAENMPGSRAYRPGDIVTAYDGQTIEVLNTDAEGRIVLADALAYAVTHYQPSLIFDMATLTGACVVALGGARAGLFTADEALRQELWSHSEDAGDPVWPLPFGDEYAEQIKSDVALVKNTGGREGGASTAASFLHHWTGGLPWVHLDIAGPAWITKELPYLEKGATGFGVRLIVDHLRRRS